MKKNNDHKIIPLLSQYLLIQKLTTFTLREEKRILIKLRKLGYKGKL